MPFFLARIRNRGPGAETGSVSRPNTGFDRIWIRNPARMKQIGIKISKDISMLKKYLFIKQG